MRRHRREEEREVADGGGGGGDGGCGDAPLVCALLDVGEGTCASLRRHFGRRYAAAVRALPPGGRELELGNLVEEAALAVLGDPKLAGAFLVACFAPDE